MAEMVIAERNAFLAPRFTMKKLSCVSVAALLGGTALKCQ